MAVLQVVVLPGQHTPHSTAALTAALDDAAGSWAAVAHDQGLQLVRWTATRWLLLAPLDPGEAACRALLHGSSHIRERLEAALKPARNMKCQMARRFHSHTPITRMPTASRHEGMHDMNVHVSASTHAGVML